MAKETFKTLLVSVLAGVILSLILGIAFLFTDKLPVLLGIVGLYISLTVSLLLAVLEKLTQQRDAILEQLRQQGEFSQMLEQAAREPFILEFFKSSMTSLHQAANVQDSFYKELLKGRLKEISRRLSDLGYGRFDFRAESWRVPWKGLLADSAVIFYNSVALVKTDKYWQDPPSIDALNFNITIAKEKPVTRICVVWDEFWTNPKVRQWIDKQNDSEIKTLVVRKSHIPSEEDLLHDIGVFGHRAVGYQHLNDKGGTERLELHFDKQSYQRAEDIFNRLKVYANEQTTKEYFGQSVETVASPDAIGEKLGSQPI